MNSVTMYIYAHFIIRASPALPNATTTTEKFNRGEVAEFELTLGLRRHFQRQDCVDLSIAENCAKEPKIGLGLGLKPG